MTSNDTPRTTTASTRGRYARRLTAALFVSAALGAGTMTAASAAQPTATLNAGQDQLFSTAFWGETSFCVTNVGSGGASVDILSWGGAGTGPNLTPGPGQTRCTAGWYFAVPAKAVNRLGSSTVKVVVTP